jgi:hypothetical protein
MALTVKIRADASQFDKTLKSVQGSISGMAGVVKAIGKGFMVAGAGLLAAGAAGGFLAIKLAKIAEEGTTAEDRLSNIVKQMDLFGQGATNVSERLVNLANKTALLVGVDQKVILSTQAKLATFKELAETADDVGGAFDRATMAAVDMAAAGFGEASQNAVQLGKALNDPIKGINSLSRSGITFTQVEKDKIKALVHGNKMLSAQDIILKAIEKQIGGTAAATANGTDRISVAVSQLTQKLGEPFAAAVSGMAEGFISQMPKITSSIDDVLSGAAVNATGFGMMAGKTFGRAIEEGIKGDLSLFGEIGAIAGKAMLIGFQEAAGNIIVESLRGHAKFTGGLGGAQGTVAAGVATDAILGKSRSAATIGMDVMDRIRPDIESLENRNRISEDRESLIEWRRTRIAAEEQVKGTKLTNQEIRALVRRPLTSR